MHRGKTTEEYIEMLEQIEACAASDAAFVKKITDAVDHALLERDMQALLRVKDMLDTPEGRDIQVRSLALLRLYYIINAIGLEQQGGFPLFSEPVADCAALLERYTEMVLLLRRIEFYPLTDAAEALAFIREGDISPYIVSAALYSVVSLLGHRERILLQLAEDALSNGRLKEAYGFLSVVEEPGDDTVLLKQELTQVLTGG